MPNFNAFMHRRNIFRRELDFKQLALEHRELKQFVTVNSKNKIKFDFKNPDALRALTSALFRKYFFKRITLPKDRLIPAVPQRLNYICWVEDLVELLTAAKIDSNLGVFGIDIGTGASCIFPILCCHRNPTWQFFGVEADHKNYSTALMNVQRNYMEDRIKLSKVEPDLDLEDILWLSAGRATFIMCNPPFFEEECVANPESDADIARTFVELDNKGLHVGRRTKSTSNTSDASESICSGGEIAFVGRLLEQSRHFKEEITIYTAMLGRKQSLIHFKQTLSSLNEDNLSWNWAELCQGKTIRYSIAWSFHPGLDLTRAPPLRHGKNKSWKVKLQRKMPKQDCQLEMLENITYLKNLIARELMIAKARISKQTGQNFEMLIKTNERTWTHQRRKRREQQFNKHKHQATSASVNFNTTNVPREATNQQLNSSDQQMICEDAGTNSSTSDALQVKDLVIQMDQCDKTDAFHSVDMSSNTAVSMDLDQAEPECHSHQEQSKFSPSASQSTKGNSEYYATHTNTASPMIDNNLQYPTILMSGNSSSIAHNTVNPKKRKNPSSGSSSPSRICPSPNDESTDDDNQSTDNSDHVDTQNEDSMNESSMEVKRLCKETDDCENMDDIYNYLLCCRISLLRVCRDIYFELKLEHPCTAASDAYDLFQYFRNKLTEK